MGKFNFYFNQGRASLKRSALVIIGLTVAISMVAGLNFYLDAYQTQSLEESYTYMADTLIYQDSRDVIVNNYATTFHEDVNQTIEVFEDHEYFHKEFYEFYETLSYDILPSTNEILTYAILPTNFYASSRFTDYFTILHGSAPVTNSEIMIEYSYALANNISAGDIIHFNYSSEYTNDAFFTEVLNDTVYYEICFKISGIFMPKRPSVRVLRSFFSFQWYLDPITLEIKVNQDYNSYYHYSYLIFSVLDFSQYISQPHPVQTMWNNLSSQVYTLTNSTINIAQYYTGLMGIYDRDSYSYRNLLSTTYELKMKIYDIRDSISFNIDGYLEILLSSYAQNMQAIRTITQFMNLPIIGFGIFIGVFSFGISTKERSDEFLLLRSKGIPQRMVRNTFLMEATLLGITSSAFAFVAGRGTYEVYKVFMGTILDIDFYAPLQFNISLTSVLTIFGIGVVMSIISCLPAIRAINKLESSELLKTLGSDNFDVAYDETTLFTINPNQKMTLADTPFMQNNLHSRDSDQEQDPGFDLTSESGSEFETSRKTPKKPAFWKKWSKPRDSNARIYRNTLKGKERQIRKRGWLLVLVSLLPGFYYLIIKLSQLPKVSDTILLFGAKLLEYFPFFIIFAALSPLLLVIGISRLLIKENPSRFAKIIKWVAHPFVKQKDYLVALQMIKQKDIRRFINLLAVFTSLFSFANIFFVSMNAVEIVTHDLETGADVHIEFRYDFIPETIGDQMGNYTVENFLAFEQNVTLSTTNSSQRFIKDSAFYIGFYREADHRGVSREYFINVSKYIHMIQEDGKFMPSRTYAEQLTNVEALLQSESPPEYPQVIVTEAYLNVYEKNIGDITEIEHTRFDPETNLTSTHKLTVQIMAAVPFFIGLWEFVPASWYPFTGMILDISLLDTIPLEWEDEDQGGEYYWQRPDFGLLCDVYEDYAQSIDVMQPLFLSALPSLLSGNRINFYHPDLKDLDNAPEELTLTYFIYRIIYIEFFIIGAITALSLAIFMLGMLRKNKYLNGLMLSRGMGWRGLNKFMLVQLALILVLALGMGLLCGVFSGIILIKMYHEIDFGGNYYPLLAKPWDFLSMFGAIIGLTLTFYGGTFYLESKKNITEYFHKF